MPDYIYLLENRLSADQQRALRSVREAAAEVGTILFLTGDAVRDLTSGHAVRGLEVTVHGSALKLKKTIEKLGGTVWGEDETAGALYLCFPGTVRVDLLSAQRVEYPKPGKPVYLPASIQEDLRQRDFTINAMAISLNEGSFGLLMDPTNGVADIETSTLRLVSNYGFLEESSLLIRATRYLARLGWEMDPKSRTRYSNAKEEGVIEYLSAQARSRELEQIGHEEDGLKVLQALEAEGWMAVLFPAWSSAKADVEKLEALQNLASELLQQGVHADMSAAQMRLLTARMTPKELTALKKLMLRPGFVEEWNSLDALAAGFAKALAAKENSIPSAGYKLFLSYDPEAVLWLGFTSKDEAIKTYFNLFLKVWPEVRQRIPHALLQEMRITSELPTYKEIVQSVFLELLDGKLSTTEEARAFLEPHSPPAPPPQVTIKKTRAKRGAEAKLKEDSYDDDESEDHLDDEEDLDDIGGDDDDLHLGMNLPKVDLDLDISDQADSIAEEEDALQDDEEENQGFAPKSTVESAPAKSGSKLTAKPKPASSHSAKTPATEVPHTTPKPKVEPIKTKLPVSVAKPKPESKPTPVPAKKSLPTHQKPATKAIAKVPVKAVVKSSFKPSAKTTPKASHSKVSAPVKPSKPSSVKKTVAPSHKPKKLVKPVAKKPAPKPAKKR